MLMWLEEWVEETVVWNGCKSHVCCKREQILGASSSPCSSLASYYS